VLYGQQWADPAYADRPKHKEKWLFLESIYGIAVIVAVIYFIAFGIKKVIPKSPHPGAITVLAFIAALFTLQAFQDTSSRVSHWLK
jgi:hypothetical protein